MTRFVTTFVDKGGERIVAATLRSTRRFGGFFASVRSRESTGSHFLSSLLPGGLPLMLIARSL